jgi:hypothetical protein
MPAVSFETQYHPFSEGAHGVNGDMTIVVKRDQSSWRWPAADAALPATLSIANPSPKMQ